MEKLILVWLGLLGACVGSFTNVVVWRWPRQESVVVPGSHCPRCGHAIRWHDNLPVLGWLLLRGRCRDCGAAISWRYPAVEAFSALLLLPLVLIDLDHLWLPEPLCRWGLVLGLLLSSTGGVALLANHLMAAAAALLLLEGLSALAERCLGQPALGLGDAKLAALGGAWVGGGGIAAALAIAVLSGAIFGCVGRVSGRLHARQAFAFGPFIALGIWLVWLTGPLWWWRAWLLLLGA